MLTSTLLLVLPFLALSDARATHPNTRGGMGVHARRLQAAKDHALARAMSEESTVANVERRSNQISSSDHGKRRVRGRACKARTSSSTTVTSASTATSTASTAGTTSATSSIAVAELAAKSSATTTSSNTKAATTASVTTTSSSTTATSTGSTSSSSLTPGGIKAGVSGDEAVAALGSHISWYYDWSPNPSASGSTSAIAIPMLWGDGTVDAQDASRLAAFKALTGVPKYVIGFEEPDCSTYGSADISVAVAATVWDTVIAPFGAKGSLLLSPSMCHQADETYLTPFSQAITRQWDITNLHINKNSMAGVQKDLDHYWNTYKKPMWITEFACVDDSNGFTPCTDQTQINTFIQEIVDLFENDSRVYAYAYSTGLGLGSVWPLWNGNSLSTSGQTYLSAISKYH